jgi:hypothetical protein
MVAAGQCPNSMVQICDFGLARIVAPSSTITIDDVVETISSKDDADPMSFPSGMAPVSHSV